MCPHGHDQKHFKESMTAAFIATIIVLAGLIGYLLYMASRERFAHRAEVRTLVDQIVLLKVDPPMAAIQAIPAEEVQTGHLSQLDDQAVAEYEAERERLRDETRAFIEARAEVVA